MPQLHFSVDAETAERIERIARSKRISVSSYIASLVTREVGEAWPNGYLEEVIGSCSSEALVEPAELPLDDVDLVRRRIRTHPRRSRTRGR